MPKVFRLKEWIVFFWSDEGEPRENLHIHVAKKVSRNATKFWIHKDKTVELAHNKSRISENELNKIAKALQIYHEDIVNKWTEHFGEEPTYKA